MLRLLADENFNEDVVRGVLLRRPDWDFIHVNDVGLRRADDVSVLAWAGDNGYVLVTHDRSTVPPFAMERVREGARMAGVFVMSDKLPVGRAIEAILFVGDCGEEREWENRVTYLPL